jgi:hypothetical protein
VICSTPVYATPTSKRLDVGQIMVGNGETVYEHDELVTDTPALSLQVIVYTPDEATVGVPVTVDPLSVNPAGNPDAAQLPVPLPVKVTVTGVIATLTNAARGVEHPDTVGYVASTTGHPLEHGPNGPESAVTPTPSVTCTLMHTVPVAPIRPTLDTVPPDAGVERLTMPVSYEKSVVDPCKDDSTPMREGLKQTPILHSPMP